jgi:hypothetical protein
MSESTHAKNLENLHVANSIVGSIGATFDPNNPLTKAAALTDFETGFAASMQEVNEKIPAEQTAVGAQMAAFKLVSGRVSKIMKAAKAQGLSPEFMANLRSTANRLNGVRVNKDTPDEIQPPPADGASGGGTHSVSRRSYAGILESLDLLDEQLKNNAGYKPNEDEYKSATITAWIESLRDLHNAALDAKLATRTARNARNAFAYNPTDGLLVRMNALKPYMETILDKNDSRLKQLKKLKFKDYSK